MRSRDQHGPSGLRRLPPFRRGRGRDRCDRPSTDEIGDQLLHPRELYVGTLVGPRPTLWRVVLADDRRSILGAPPAADDPDVVLQWAARQLLTAALRYDVSTTAVRALADELPQITGPELELSDLGVRLWFLGWRLQHRAER
jgi:hypothetical protein